MTDPSADDSALLDADDKRIVRALQLSPRAPFSLIGAVVGLSEQTVARRYRRLTGAGLLRITAVVNPQTSGHMQWLARVRCRPDGANAVADALARRADVSWVTIVSGGAAVMFNLRPRHERDAEDLLGWALPKSAPVLDLSAEAVLHTFVGADSGDWRGWAGVLTEHQSARLRPPRPPQPPAPPPSDPTAPVPRPSPETCPGHRVEDAAMLSTLSADGRADYQKLARATGMSAGRARRRLDRLLTAGTVFFDVDIAPAATGLQAPTVLQLTVSARHLDAAGRALARHPLVPFAAATTGRANLVATLTADGPATLYRFATTTLAEIDGVTDYELAPTLRQVKQSGAFVVGGRLSTAVPPHRSGSRAGARSRR